jgi:hypothetical protein
MHVVSLTPHAQKNFRTTSKSENHMQNSDGMPKNLNACSVIDTASTCVCGINDTACTIDERFERPWQPLKGIFIKNIYVPELSYPATKKIYKFEGAT